VGYRSRGLKFHRRTVAIWIVLGALITVTSVLALEAGGVEALYLVVTGWIVGPFFILWAYRKLVKRVGGKG
jgi:hypothetical protein